MTQCLLRPASALVDLAHASAEIVDPTLGCDDVDRDARRRAGLAASTVTPGSTAPDTSFTVPVIDALTPCARALAGRQIASVNTPINLATRLMNRPPYDGPVRQTNLCGFGVRTEIAMKKASTYEAIQFFEIRMTLSFSVATQTSRTVQ
jgi:hypothetical protein